MTAPSQRAALDAVHSARPIVARMSTARDKEDLAADIIEAWTAVETGLRSLVGGSALAGQALIRELRQRHFLTLEQANALAEFNAARERASRTDYVPNEADINATRDAFLKLEAGLMGEPAAAIPGGAVPGTTAPAVVIADEHHVSPPGRRSPVALIGALAGLLLIGVLAWWLMSSRTAGHSGSYNDGVTAYREGRREAAEGAFRKAITDDPKDAMPHVYLARMEREKGNINNANVEAVKAVEIDGKNGIALRELASVRFAQQDFDGARRFYTRAIEADPTDRVSQGFLGCSLIRLGRIDEGMKFVNRAGTGAWSACTPAPGTTRVPAAANPAVPMTVPRP